MTTTNDAPTTTTHRCGGRRPPSAVGGALTALLALWLLLLFTALTSVSAAATTGSPCSGFTQRSTGCASAFVDIGAGGEEEGEEAAEEEAEGEGEEEGETAVAGSPSSGSSVTNAVVLSKLKLTAQAGAALKHPRPTASVVGFSFTLSAATKVRVTLVKQTRVQGRTQWVTLPNSLTLTAAKGQDRGSLKGHNRLSPGRYRLTLKPATGQPHSIYLRSGG